MCGGGIDMLKMARMVNLFSANVVAMVVVVVVA
jgi:hypothetical protein